MNDNIEININNSLINSSPNVKYLGITIDQKLNFIEHTNQIINRVNLRIKLLSVMNRYNNSHPITNINLIKALIIPVIMYGSSIWIAGRKQNTKRMDILINKCLRIATGLLKSTQIIFIRGITEIPMLEDKVTELNLRRIQKIATEPEGQQKIKEMFNFKNRFKEKLYLRHIVKKHIVDINTEELEGDVPVQIQLVPIQL